MRFKIFRIFLNTKMQFKTSITPIVLKSLAHLQNI